MLIVSVHLKLVLTHSFLFFFSLRSSSSSSSSSSRRRRSDGDKFVHVLHEGLDRAWASVHLGFLTGLNDVDGGVTSYIELSAEGLIAVRIDLSDTPLPAQLLCLRCEVLPLWGEVLAVHAPRGVELDDHWRAGVLRHRRIKVVAVHLKHSAAGAGGLVTPAGLCLLGLGVGVGVGVGLCLVVGADVCVLVVEVFVGRVIAHVAQPVVDRAVRTDLLGGLPGLEEQDGGEGADLEALRKLFLLLAVHLADVEQPLRLVGKVLPGLLDELALMAPVHVELDHPDAVLGLGVEVLVS